MKQFQILREKCQSAKLLGAVALEWVGGDFDEKETVRLEIDAQGRFRREANDHDQSISGFDGEEAWIQGATGLTRNLAYSERDTLLDMAPVSGPGNGSRISTAPC